MAVSQHVISWIQIIGLLIGLMGVFYVTLPVSDRPSLRYLRPVLPATALLIIGMLGPVLALNPSQKPDPGSVVLDAGVGFILGYRAGILSQNGKFDMQRALRVGAFMVFVGLSLEWFVHQWLPSQAPTPTAPRFALFLVWISCYVIGLVLPSRLSKDWLQYIGIGASVLAALTQFIPPVLDLLNIPIK